MRRLITRLTLVGIVGIALAAGCGSQNGTTLPSGGGGGGPINQGNNNPPPPGTEPIIFIDNGTFNPPVDAYAGFNTVITDTQGSGNATLGATQYPFAPFPEPVEPVSPPDGGNHQIFLNGNNLTQLILKFTGSINQPTSYYPGPGTGLVYKFGVQGNSPLFNYTGIVLHANYPAVSSLPFPSSVAIELVGNGTAAGPGPLASTYDVRITCNSGDALMSPPNWAYMICLMPGGSGTAAGQGALGYGKAVNSAGPNAIVPGAAGTFTPVNPAFYLVLNFGKATVPADAATLGLDYIYAFQ